jgi:hypothetical protein
LSEQFIEDGVGGELAALNEPIEQLGHEGVQAMRADAATGLPQHLRRGGHVRTIASRPAGARRGGRGARRASEQRDGRLPMHAGHGDGLVQQAVLLGAGGMLVPLSLHGRVLPQAGSVTAPSPEELVTVTSDLREWLR